VEADEVADTLRELNQIGSVDGMASNIAHVDEIENLVTRAEAFLGRIDILINNAGIAWEEPFLEITPEHWDQIMQVNLRGMFLVGQAVARRMMADKKGGAIVNMSSTNGLVGEELYAHYNATKGGVLLLTKTMALELGRYGIRTNAVCPGFIQTPLSQSIYDPQAIAAYSRDKIPMQRPGKPEEVAAAYAFLASDEASFINGEGLVIDGGQVAV
jgi:3-oxoacyl-[acyl-carrier protein] reductase